jgi:hypothetical protein
MLHPGFLPLSLDPEDGGDMFIGTIDMKKQYKRLARQLVTFGEDGKVILKWSLRKWDEILLSVFIWLTIGTSAELL